MRRPLPAECPSFLPRQPRALRENHQCGFLSFDGIPSAASNRRESLFLVHLTGQGPDGIETEQLPMAFPTLDAAIDKAEALMENHSFPWGKATAFTITDGSDTIVLSGSIQF